MTNINNDKEDPLNIKMTETRAKYGNRQIVVGWKMAPICRLGCIWKERNGPYFEDWERKVNELKSLFFNTLFLWTLAIGFNGLSFHNFLVSIFISLFNK